MKYVIVIPDGCADEPQKSLGGRTPLQAARLPHMDRAAAAGCVGESNNTPDSLNPASDVCTLSLLGYDPLRYYTGRAPLEAAAMGIELGAEDWALRCNLVTVQDEKMVDFSGGHVSTDDGHVLMKDVIQDLSTPQIEFIPGVSYRNIMVYRGSGSHAAPFGDSTKTQPPHDIPGQSIVSHLPSGSGSELLIDLMERSRSLFRGHTTNKARASRGEKQITQVWLWGQGQAPSIDSFAQVYGKKAVMITAVDLLRGVGALLGWDRIDIPTATGYLDTDYAAKGRAGVKAIADYDLVCVHVEAPDEASHEGRADAKVEALEEIDKHVVGPLWDALQSESQWRILISPDHPTPVRTRAHGRGTVPWVVAGAGIQASGSQYDEPTGARGPVRFDPGFELMSWFLGDVE